MTPFKRMTDEEMIWAGESALHPALQSAYAEIERLTEYRSWANDQIDALMEDFEKQKGEIDKLIKQLEEYKKQRRRSET